MANQPHFFLREGKFRLDVIARITVTDSLLMQIPTKVWLHEIERKLVMLTDVTQITQNKQYSFSFRKVIFYADFFFEKFSRTLDISVVTLVPLFWTTLGFKA